MLQSHDLVLAHGVVPTDPHGEPAETPLFSFTFRTCITRLTQIPPLYYLIDTVDVYDTLASFLARWGAPILFGFFASVTLATYRGRFYSAAAILQHIPLLGSARHRIDAVCTHLSDFESPTVGNISLAIAVVSLAFTAASALLPLSIVLWYAAFNANIALVFALAFLTLRKRMPYAVASLKPRSISSVMPWFVWILSAAFALSPLAYFPFEPDAAIIATLSAGVTLEIARRVACMPSLLVGDDPDAEFFVDRYVRAKRALAVLTLVGFQVFFFASISNTSVVSNRETHAAYALLSSFVILGTNFIILRTQIWIGTIGRSWPDSGPVTVARAV